MYALKEIPRAVTQDISRTGNTAYIVVVPGLSHDDLTQQTCSHFEDFVQKLAQSLSTPTRSFVFQHGIRAESISTWEQFAEAGNDLMKALDNLRDRGELVDTDDLLLIGHGLGGFIVKKALVIAHRKLRHSDYVSEVLAMLIMLGVPHLDLENKPDWVGLVTACVPKYWNLPSKLAHEESMLCLKAICDSFESFTTKSPLVRVSDSLDSKPKINLSFRRKSRKKKSKLQGCISAAKAVVREFTTRDPERVILDENESHGVCALSENSAHHHFLIAWANEARQNVYLEANSDQVDAPQPRAGMTHQLTTSEVTEPTELPLKTLDTSTSSDVVITLSEPSEKSPDVVDSSEEDIGGASDEEFLGRSSASSEMGIENPSTHSDLISSEPRLGTPSTSSFAPFVGPVMPFRYLPHSRDPSFFAHNDTLQAIEDHLIAWVPSKTQKHQFESHSRVCILHGLAGIGKTSIALETAYRTLDQFNFVFWIAADSESKLSTEIHKIAVKMHFIEESTRCDHSKSISTFLKWVEQSGARSLFIFDGVESLPLVQGILPATSNVSVLITTRDRTMGNFLTNASSSAWLKAIEVPPLSDDEATIFFRQRAEHCIEADDPSACRSLASKLEGIPLAIRQAATYINLRHLTFAEYLELYDSQIDDLTWISQERNSKRESYDSTPEDTFEICFRSLSKHASALLNVISFLHPDGIAESILTSAQCYNEVPLEYFPRTVLDYTGARTELWNTSLCKLTTKSRLLTTHRLVQSRMRLHLSCDELKAGLRTASLLLLSQWPSKKKIRSSCLGSWPEFDDLQCHVNSLAKVYTELNADTNPNMDRKITAPDCFVRVLVYSSWYNWQRGSPSQGKPLFDLACEIFKESSIKSADSRRLKVSRPQITFMFKDVEGILSLLDHDENTDPKTVSDGGRETIGIMVTAEKNSPKTPDPVVTEAPSSPQESEKSSARDDRSSNIQSNGLEDNSRHQYHPSAQTDRAADDGTEDGFEDGFEDGQMLRPKRNSYADAYARLQEGVGLIADQKYFEAIASLMAVKDSVSAFQGATSRRYQIYFSASRYIGILYWLNGNMDLSLQTLSRTLNLYQEVSRNGEQDPLLHGQILFALGNVYLKTRRLRQSLSNFTQALGIFESVDEGSDWIAVTRLKLADLHVQEQKHEQAHALLQQCLRHFQSQSTLSAQAQRVRAIHRQALVYDAEGNEMMAKIFHAAARDGRAEYRRAKGIPDPEAGMPVEQKDLEADVEFWYR